MPEGLLHVEQEQCCWNLVQRFLKNKQVLKEKVLKYILSLPTSYLCEVVFPAFVDIKSKKKNRLLDVEPHFRLTSR